MNNIRWYDKNPKLADLIMFVEELDESQKAEIAKHILQILLNECNLDFDFELGKILNNDYPFNRWYDQIYDLSSAFEIIKSLSPEMQNFLVAKTINAIIMANLKKD